jgi:hypothetical protein
MGWADGEIWIIIARRSGLDGAMSATIVEIWVSILQVIIFLHGIRVTSCHLLLFVFCLFQCRCQDLHVLVFFASMPNKCIVTLPPPPAHNPPLLSSSLPMTFALLAPP